VVFHAERRQRTGDTEDEREVVHHDHHHIDCELRPNRGVRQEVQNAVEEVTRRERARVGHRHRDGKGDAEPPVQQREEHQIEGERGTVDHDEAEKCRRHNGIQSERQACDDDFTQPVEGLHAHIGTLT